MYTSDDPPASFSFFWLDVLEGTSGSVVVIGRTNAQSVCVEVRRIRRVLYAEMEQGTAHDAAIRDAKAVLREWHVCTCTSSIVTRSLCGKDPVPMIRLEFSYGPTLPKPDDARWRDALESARTLKDMHGWDIGPVERFLLDTGIKGPCWLHCDQTFMTPVVVSRCAWECAVDPAHIHPLHNPPSIPPLHTVAWSIEVDSEGALTSIALVDYGLIPLHHDGEPLSRTTFPIDTLRTEPTMLRQVFETVSLLDPDVMVGHDLLWIVERLAVRACQCRLGSIWANMGRLGRTVPASGIQHHAGHPEHTSTWTRICSGRLLCDTRIGIKLWIDGVADASLPTLASQWNLPRSDDTVAWAATTSFRVAQHLDMLVLSHDLASICGSLWGRSLLGRRNERNEWLLMHAFHQHNVLIPDRRRAVSSKYEGGLVLDPVRGHHGTLVLLLDFQSLYPSIIQEYRLCPTTFSAGNESMVDGVLPGLIRTLVDARRALDLETRVSRVRARALKLVANSIYGGFGFPSSRFYLRDLAQDIAQRGRAILTRTVDTVGKCGGRVLYGDTDSVMVDTHTTTWNEAMALGTAIRERVNASYRVVRLKTDAVFRSLVLFQKKRYAGLGWVPDGKDGPPPMESWMRHVKGLDLVRHDGCRVSRRLDSKLVDLMLHRTKDDTWSESIYALLRAAARWTDGTLQDFVLEQELTKALDKYAPGDRSPHVVVARALVESGNTVRPGDRIAYVVCTSDQRKARVSDRARPVADVSMGDVDVAWYMRHHVWASVKRLLSPLPDVSLVRAAEAFGLDPDTIRLPSLPPVPVPEPLRVTCPTCRTDLVFSGMLVYREDDVVSGWTCTPTCAGQGLWKAMAEEADTRTDRDLLRVLFDVSRAWKQFKRNNKERANTGKTPWPIPVLTRTHVQWTLTMNMYLV